MGTWLGLRVADWVVPEMDIEKYRQYARTPEAFAVLFVKKYLNSADKSVWVDILSYNAPAGYDVEDLKFKRVECELFPRKTRPAYPPRSQYRSQSDYETACRAITWETANRDIAAARARGYVGRKYRIDAVSYLVPGKKPPRPDPDRYFRDNAPPEIKALARNLNDRTDKLWDYALNWVRPEYRGTDDRYEFKIRGIRRLGQ